MGLSLRCRCISTPLKWLEKSSLSPRPIKYLAFLKCFSIMLSSALTFNSELNTSNPKDCLLKESFVKFHNKVWRFVINPWINLAHWNLQSYPPLSWICPLVSGSHLYLTLKTQIHNQDVVNGMIMLIEPKWTFPLQEVWNLHLCCPLTPMAIWQTLQSLCSYLFLQDSAVDVISHVYTVAHSLTER